jgi:ABC-2 type transport system permease protein
VTLPAPVQERAATASATTSEAPQVVRAAAWARVCVVARTQLRLSTREVEDLLPVLVMPLLTFASMAIFSHAGRRDLAGHALTASTLITLGQMGFFVGSEIVSADRRNQILELLVAASMPYGAILATRVAVVTSLGLLGFVEAWGIARLAFGTPLVVVHVALLLATLLATALAASGTALLFSALFGLARTTRTFQHAVNGPFYLLGGVLVPTTYLPAWLQSLSPLTFFYWSAELLRDCLRASAVEHAAARLGAIIGIGLLTGALGYAIVDRMLFRLRRDGTLGLV